MSIDTFRPTRSAAALAVAVRAAARRLVAAKVACASHAVLAARVASGGPGRLEEDVGDGVDTTFSWCCCDEAGTSGKPKSTRFWWGSVPVGVVCAFG